MQIKRFLFLLLLTFMVSGCANVGGNNSKLQPDYLNKNIITGKTTQHEVLELLGAPESRSTDSSGETTWRYPREQGANLLDAAYSSISGTIPGANAAIKANNELNRDKGGYDNSLYIYFDKDGVVRLWNM